MGRILLEGGIVILLVLIGISVFIPGGNDVNDVIVEFENSIESGNGIEDGQIDNVEIGEEYDANFIARMTGKIANSIVNGLNSVFEIGIRLIRKAIN